MKKILITLLLFAGSLGMNAQDIYWETNLNKAADQAMKQNKPLLLFFTGSDWCGWCIRLQKEVLKTPEFADWATKNVVLVELDFPRRTQLPADIAQQNMQLQQILEVRGYPTVWLVTPTKKDGKMNLSKLGSTGYVAGGPSKWLESANQILANAQPAATPATASKKG